MLPLTVTLSIVVVCLALAFVLYDYDAQKALARQKYKRCKLKSTIYKVLLDSYSSVHSKSYSRTRRRLEKWRSLAKFYKSKM